MDQQKLRQWEALCTQEEPPRCRAACPLGVDARAFALAMSRDDLDAARALLEKSMPLIGITARLCEAPCEEFCLRKDLGGAVSLGGLEKLCVQETRPKGKILRLPARPKNVAVLGAGPGGLTVAFDLAKKGYPVTVYYLPPGPGSWLRTLPDTVLPPEILKQEMERLTALQVVFTETAALDAALAQNCTADSLYLDQDDALNADLLPLLGPVDPKTMATDRAGWFTGGMDLAQNSRRFITALSHGREAAVSIDRFLQGASLTSSRVELRQGQTSLFTQTRDIAPVPRVIPAEANGYSRAEAIREAARCLDCQCLECVRHCVYMQEYGAHPKAYARRVFNNSAIVQGNRQANKFINSCSLCSQCETLCPNDFSMATMCLDARQQMVRENRMPASAHWFALEEMRSATGQAALIRHASGQSSSRQLFFPGCQLAGIRPEQTLGLYDALLELEPHTGIWLDCCAAPAHWAGRVEEYSALRDQLAARWHEMGQPKVVIACSTCLQMFRDHLPQIEAVSVWTMLAESGLTAPHGQMLGTPLALSDPCTSRYDSQTREAVRTLLEQSGQVLAPLPMSGEMTECCGFGGLMDNANPALARKVAQARVAQSDAPFLTYCAMCRDQLAKTGKPVLHLLDLIFPDTAHSAEELPSGISARRTGRRQLRASLLARHGQSGAESQPWDDIRLTIPAPVAALLEERRILEDDLRQVLFLARKAGRWFAHGSDGRSRASAELGEVTFWVEYREENSGYEVLRAWSHRMRIMGGRT